MKRSTLVEKLIKEGMSEKTLVRFTDKQLLELSERMLGEGLTATMADISKSPALQAAAKDPKQNIRVVGEEMKGEMDESLHGIMIGATKEKLKKELGRDPKDHEVEKELGKFVDSWKKDNESKEKNRKNPYNPGKPPTPNFGGNKKKEVDEELKGNQKKLDKNHNGKIDAQDFKILKGQKKEVKEANWRKSFEKEPSRKDWKHFNADGEELKNEPRMKGGYSIDKEGKRHEARVNQEVKKSSEVKEWVEKLVENKYHSFTSKNEIMELISVKLNESDTMVQHGPKVKKGHNGVPEFMTYDSIVDAAEPKTAPTTKPAPTKEPGTKPTPNKDPRKTPFRPGPGPNPKPKALKETKKSK